MPEHVVDAAVDTEALSMIERPPNACIYHPDCEGEAPGNNSICPDCLDALRTRDREEGYDDYGEYLSEGPRGIW